MGQQASKDVRSRLEYCNLEELLNDDKYVKELERHLPGLPKRSHNNLVKILASWKNIPSGDSNSGSKPNPLPKSGNSSPSNRNLSTYKLSALWSIQSKDINIPQSVAEALKQNHCTLFRQSSKNGADLESPADYYEYMCSVEIDRTLDKILWRFLTTFYYDLISELDATKQRLSKSENGGVAFVVAIVCQSGKHDPDTVREKVMGWVKVGRRYRGFMDALCSGCLILLPEKTSDLVWEKHVPIKGDTFVKVIQFLRDLGIVYKCEEEGWNDLSDKILQTLREPFRNLIPFQFQPGQQSQIEWAANSSLAPVAGDGDIHRSTLSREEIHDMDIDNPPSSRSLDLRAPPRLTAKRVVKTKQKKGTTSVRRELQNFARRAHRPEPHRSGPQGRFPQAPTQCWASTLNDPRQWHLATNHQDDRLLSSQVSINDRGRDPLSDISLNATKIDGADQQHSKGESLSNTLRTSISTISALLNHDNNTPAAPPATTQESSAAAAGDGITLLMGIQFEKHTLLQIVLEQPTEILGGIWFCKLPGYLPFVSLRLSRALDIVVKPSGQAVYVPGPSPHASSTVTETYLIKLEYFKQMIERDGFGKVFWNECGEAAFVTMEVTDQRLVANFVRGAVQD